MSTTDIDQNEFGTVDSATIEGTGAPKPKWNPKGKKNLIIIGVVLLVVIALMILMFSGGKKDPVKSSYIPQAENGRNPGKMSDEDSNAYISGEKQRLANAKQAGDSGLEQPLHETPIIEDAPATKPAAEPQYSTTPRSPQTQQAAAAPTPVDQEKMQGLERQMTVMMSSWGMGPQQAADARTYIRVVKNTEGAANNTAIPTASANTSASKGFVVVPAFEKVFSAKIDNTFDSDAPGAVRARILTGPLAGATINGTGAMKQQGVSVSFTSASLNGKLFKINASAIDEKTSSDIVEGTYDGRIAQRFIFPIVAAGVTAGATALSQTGSQAYVVGTGGVATNVPAPTTQQATNAMIAAGAAQTNALLQAQQYKAQATLPINTTFGLVFNEPVFDTDLSK